MQSMGVRKKSWSEPNKGSLSAAFVCVFRRSLKDRWLSCCGAAQLVIGAIDAHDVIADAFNTQPEICFDCIKHVVDFTHLEYPADAPVG